MRRKVVTTNGYVHRGCLLLLPTEPPAGFSHGDTLAIVSDVTLSRAVQVMANVATSVENHWPVSKETAAKLRALTDELSTGGR